MTDSSNWSLNHQIFFLQDSGFVDLFASRLNFKLKKLCQLETRPSKYRSGCFHDSLGDNKGLCFPALLPDRSLSCKSKERQSNTYSNNSSMVTTAAGNAHPRSNSTTNLSRTITVVPRGAPSTDSVEVSDTSGLEDFREPCFANELSVEAASLHGKAWRPGTQVTYKSC